jgi:plasmid stabilization system protein ParE
LNVSRYIFGKHVESDLREIRDYVAQDSPAAARRIF